jgi:hypothetical protein
MQQLPKMDSLTIAANRQLVLSAAAQRQLPLGWINSIRTIANGPLLLDRLETAVQQTAIERASCI